MSRRKEFDKEFVKAIDRVKTPEEWRQRALDITGRKNAGLQLRRSVLAAAATAAMILGLIVLPAIALRDRLPETVKEPEKTAVRTSYRFDEDEDRAYAELLDKMEEEYEELMLCQVESVNEEEGTLIVRIKESSDLNYNSYFVFLDVLRIRVTDNTELIKDFGSEEELRAEDLGELAGHKVLIGFNVTKSDFQGVMSNKQVAEIMNRGVEAAAVADANGIGIHCLVSDPQAAARVREMEKHFDAVRLGIVVNRPENVSQLNVISCGLFGTRDYISVSAQPTGKDFTGDSPTSGLILGNVKADLGDLAALGFNGRQVDLVSELYITDDLIDALEPEIRDYIKNGNYETIDYNSLMGYAYLGPSGDQELEEVANSAKASLGPGAPEESVFSLVSEYYWKKGFNMPTATATDGGGDKYELIPMRTIASQRNNGVSADQRYVIALRSRDGADIMDSRVTGTTASPVLEIGGESYKIWLSTIDGVEAADIYITGDSERSDTVYLVIDVIAGESGYFTDQVETKLIPENGGDTMFAVYSYAISLDVYDLKSNIQQGDFLWADKTEPASTIKVIDNGITRTYVISTLVTVKAEYAGTDVFLIRSGEDSFSAQMKAYDLEVGIKPLAADSVPSGSSCEINELGEGKYRINTQVIMDNDLPMPESFEVTLSLSDREDPTAEPIDTIKINYNTGAEISPES